MYVIFWILGGVLSLFGFICFVIGVINAFKTDTTQGILSLCVPIYVLYFLFAKSTMEKRKMVAFGMLGGYILGGVLYSIGTSMAVSVQGMTAYPGMPAGIPGMTGMPGMPMTGMPMTGWPMTAQ
jgi:hypothetical protein